MWNPIEQNLNLIINKILIICMLQFERHWLKPTRWIPLLTSFPWSLPTSENWPHQLCPENYHHLLTIVLEFISHFQPLHLLYISCPLSALPVLRAHLLSLQFPMAAHRTSTEALGYYTAARQKIIILLLYFKTGAPNLQDLMPLDLRWSWCNNNRYKVHNKCNTLESSQTLPCSLFQSVEKLSSMKLVPGAKKVGDCCFKMYF